MENLLPILFDGNYITKNKLKSIKLFIRHLNEPSLSSEFLAYRFEFYNNGFVKTQAALGLNGKYAELIEFNDKGQKIKKIEDRNNTATRSCPEINTTIFEYSNDLLIIEREYVRSTDTDISEMERLLLPTRSRKNDGNDELYRKRLYKYDSKERLIEVAEENALNNSISKETFEYLDEGITVVYDEESSYVILKKHNLKGVLIEEKGVYASQYGNSDEAKYEFKRVYLYDDDLIIEMQQFDRNEELFSNMKYIYNSGLLSSIEIYENNKLEEILRFENE